MATSLERNAYHILGLSAGAGTKLVLRRSNEILQLIELGETPEYEYDLKSPDTFRSAEAVRDAVRRLQNPKQRLSEYFFWFDEATLPETAAGALERGDYQGVATACREADKTASDRQLRRQEALASLLSVGGDRQKALETLEAWKRVLNDDAFWAEFSEQYRFDGQVAASEELISSFRADAVAALSDIFLEIIGSAEHLRSLFGDVFASASGQLREIVLKPQLEKLAAANSALANVACGEGDKLAPATLAALRPPIENIQAALNELIDNNLFEDSEVRLARDRSAFALRRIVLDLHNHHNEFAVAHRLLEIAASIAGTDGLSNQLKNEIGEVAAVLENDKANTLAIEVPGTFGGGTIVFKNEAVMYDRVKLRYDEISSISYSSMLRSMNFVPYSQTYSFELRGPQGSISINYGTTLYIGNTAKRDAWARMAGVAGQLIEPLIVRKLVQRIFGQGASISIGDVTFDRNGYTRSKTFGGTESVSWGPNVYVPQFSSGNVVLWRDKNGSAAQFAAVPMSVPNAVVIPELAKACAVMAGANA